MGSFFSTPRYCSVLVVDPPHRGILGSGWEFTPLADQRVLSAPHLKFFGFHVHLEDRGIREGGRTLVGSRCRPVTRSGGVRRECGVSPFRMSRRPRSSLHGGHLGELRVPANRSRKTRCNT